MLPADQPCRALLVLPLGPQPWALPLGETPGRHPGWGGVPGAGRSTSLWLRVRPTQGTWPRLVCVLPGVAVRKDGRLGAGVRGDSWRPLPCTPVLDHGAGRTPGPSCLSNLWGPRGGTTLCSSPQGPRPVCLCPKLSSWGHQACWFRPTLMTSSELPHTCKEPVWPDWDTLFPGIPLHP